MSRPEAEEIAHVVCNRHQWKCDETLSMSRGWRTWIVRPAADGVATGPWIHIDARTKRVLRFDQRPPGERRMRYLAGGLIVAAVVLVLSTYFGSRVCDQKESTRGSGVVSVCRHVNATDPPVIAIGIVILACLGMFFSEISGFGVSLKRQVQEVAEVAKSAQQLGLQTETAVKTIRETTDDLTDYNRQKTTAEVEQQPSIGVAPAAGLDAELGRLAGRYNTLRGTMSSGPERTRQMSAVVKAMQAALRDVDGFDVLRWMDSPDRGVRLVAYAYLEDHVAPDLLPRVVDLVAREDKPFGQYWGLLAVENQLELSPAKLTDEGRRKLQDMQARIGPATDRGSLIRRILAR